MGNLSNRKLGYEKTAGHIVKKLQARGFEAYYFENGEEAVKKALDIMEQGSSVAWGGSETIKEIGLMDEIRKGDYVLYDRATAATPEEKREMYAKHVTSDYFLMSSNAVTVDGELVNVDGFGNRVACLITGPENVLVFVGMNKIVANVEEGRNRVKIAAAPPNGVRLGLNTPCSINGVCGECLSDECMCCNTVITRKSKIPGRVKVFLIGEELGF